MSKEELIEQLDIHIEKICEVKVFLESLRPETLLAEIFVHSVVGFLVTACDYLEVNLTEISNKVRMS